MDPFVALAYFTSSQVQDLKSLTFAADFGTLSVVYLSKKHDEKNQNEVYQVFDQATNKVQEIIEIQDEDPILMLEKAKNFAKEFLGIIESQKRKLSELDLQALEAQKKKYTADDFQFIESMSVPRNWKKIYDAGKIKDLFNSYTSADSLKSSYHHAIKCAKKHI